MKKIALLLVLALLETSAIAQVEPGAVLQSSILEDLNGDGAIEVMAFGDSITRGVGDFNPFGSLVDDEEARAIPLGEAGYPLRLEGFFGIGIDNEGSPGELLNGEGIERFARLVGSRRPDYVAILDGSNDAFQRTASSTMFSSFQALINIARVNGVEPVLITPAPTCCDRAFLNPFISSYAEEIRNLAVINEVLVADINRAFRNNCPSLGSCPLLNRREGLHPNQGGYDVVAEVLTASLLGLDIFSENGPRELENRLGLTPGTARTQPDAEEN